jgi:hypothetical protein
MSDLPAIALSVRQPWAWCIVHLKKPCENRSKGFFGHRTHASFQRPIAIHASKGMTQQEYRDCAEFVHDTFGQHVPPPAELVRGGIVGHARCVDVISKSNSPWFFGPFALMLTCQQEIEQPIPCQGALGYFEWKEGGQIDRPLPWMLKWGQKADDSHLLDFEKVKI